MLQTVASSIAATDVTPVASTTASPTATTPTPADTPVEATVAPAEVQVMELLLY